MKKKQQKLQFAFLVLGIVLFVLTYLYYPNINKDKNVKKQLLEKTDENEEFTSFENLEFKGLYNFTKPFTVKSESAFINEENPDLVIMTRMHVILYLEGNRIVNITSLKGRYNKSNYDCFFEQDVVATDEETVITADNLDLLAEKNIIEIYNNVSLNYPTGILWADRMQYDFKSKLMKITDSNAVKMKIIR